MIRLFLIFNLSLFTVACSSLEPLEPELTEDAEVLETAVIRLPERELLTYRGTWKGIPAGKVLLRFERQGERYRCSGNFHTTGVVSVLYGVDFKTEEVARTEDRKSLSFSYTMNEGEEDEKKVMVRFAPETGRILSVIRKPEKVDRLTRESPEAHGPFGLVYAFRCADLVPGKSFRTAVFTEWYVYQANAVVVGLETVKVPAGEFETVLVRVDLFKVKKGVVMEESRGAAIWLTADERRVPVKIVMDTKIGLVTMSLADYEGS